MIFIIGSHDEEETISLGQAIQDSCERRKSCLDHDYAITGWALSILPEICANVLSDLTGEHCLMIENVVERLHVACSPLPKQTSFRSGDDCHT